MRAHVSAVVSEASTLLPGGGEDRDGAKPASGEGDGQVAFTDHYESWTAVPDWVVQFVQLGYRWQPAQSARRICILSMPCDSPAAALVALGLMRRRLEIPGTGDRALHLERLRNLYRQARERTVLRRVGNRKKFVFADADPDGSLKAHVAGDPTQTWRILETHSHDWFVDGEPPVQLTHGGPLETSSILEGLVPNAAAIDPENLSRSDSAICLAGRVAGGSRTYSELTEVRFRYLDDVESLGSLLTIHGWHAGRISRMSFFNARTKEFDRLAQFPLVVCVDGAAALDRVLGDTRFQATDIIAAVPRTSDPEQLDAIAQRLAALAQWYVPLESRAEAAVSIPVGVNVLTLTKG